jgi:hypothetical protein
MLSDGKSGKAFLLNLLKQYLYLESKLQIDRKCVILSYIDLANRAKLQFGSAM